MKAGKFYGLLELGTFWTSYISTFGKLEVEKVARQDYHL